MLSKILHNLFSAQTADTNNRHSLNRRRLMLESLENRELLSVTPLSSPIVIERDGAALIATQEITAFSDAVPQNADSNTTVLYENTVNTNGVYDGERKLPSETINIQAGISEVTVYYRFTTAEVPNGWFGSKYNDYYRISVNASGGESFSDGNNMNTIGLSNFDSNGTTQWMSRTIKVNSAGDALTLNAAVANVGDDIYDSFLEIRIEAEDAPIFNLEVENKIHVTGQPIELKAVFNQNILDKYEISKVDWQVINNSTKDTREGDVGNRTNIEASPESKNSTPWTYDAATNTIKVSFTPDFGNHGEKTVKFSVTLKDKETGELTPLNAENQNKFRLQIFFEHIGKDPANPNWFKYWGEDGAVPLLNVYSSIISYDHTDPNYGGYNPDNFGTGDIVLGQAVNGVNDQTSSPIAPSGLNKYGSGRDGIYCITETLSHELQHRDNDIQASADTGPEYYVDWSTRQAIAKKQGHKVGSPEEHAFFNKEYAKDTFASLIKEYSHIQKKNDTLSPSLESTFGTWTILTDTWYMEGISSSYWWYGDDEYTARLAENTIRDGKVSNPKKDWSDQGELAKTIGSKSALSLIQNTSESEQAETSSQVDQAEFIRIVSVTSGIFSDNEFVEQSFAESAENRVNGLYETLQFTADIRVSQTGDYWLTFDLYDSQSNQVCSILEQVNLTAGLNSIEISVPSAIIRSNAANGALTASFALSDSQWQSQDALLDAITTKYYSIDEFASSVAVGDIVEETIDINGNSLYDTLSMTVPVHIATSGNYTYVTQILDKNGNIAASAVDSHYFTRGDHQLDLNFDGQLIFSSGLDGPYSLNINFVDTVSRESIFSADSIYQTAAYQHTQFEGSQAAFSDTFSDRARDTDGDGKFDVLTIDVGLDVAKAGQYEVIGYLQDANGNYAGYASVNVALVAGTQTVSLDFDSVYLFADASNTSWTLSSLMLRDAANSVFLANRTNAYTTTAYSRSDFQSSGIVFTGNNSDIGIDNDGNGKYEILQVNLGVAVETPGNYDICALVLDNDGNIVGQYNRTVFLNVGDTVATLEIDGKSFSIGEYDGPYSLAAITMYNEQYDLVAVSSTYTTAAYSFNDFENDPIRLGAVTDKLVDTNGDAVADWLCIDVEVYVEQTGYYDLSAQLLSSSENQIATTSLSSIYLVSGTANVVTLEYDVQSILANKENGPYFVKGLAIHKSGDYQTGGLFVWDVHETKPYTSFNIATIRAVATAQTTLSLDWNNVDGATQYVLQRKGPGETEFVEIYIGTESKYVDRGLTAGTSYEYRVQADGAAFSDVDTLTTAPSHSGSTPLVDSPMILSSEYDAVNKRNTITWTNLGPDYVYTVYKAGRIVVNAGANASYVDTSPADAGTDGYTIMAYNKELRQYSNTLTAVVSSTAPTVEITGVEFLANGSTKLLWDAQPGMLYMVMQAGRSVSGAGYLETNSWTDTNPDASKEYLLVALYQDQTGVWKSTFSNLFSAKRPGQSLEIADEAFWSEYALNEDWMTEELL